jgi:hypothetical protein
MVTAPIHARLLMAGIELGVFGWTQMIGRIEMIVRTSPESWFLGIRFCRSL